MIVWIGPQMESYLNKVIQQQTAVKVQATQSSGINLLAARTADKNHHSGHSSDYQSIGTNIAPHIWLSPNNVVAIPIISFNFMLLTLLTVIAANGAAIIEPILVAAANIQQVFPLITR